MASSKLSTRFVAFVVTSLVTHLLELATGALFCHVLFQQTGMRTFWFSLAAGLFVIPLVAVQLASAVLLLRHKTETYATSQVVATAVLHVLQLGFISRHFSILKEAPMLSKRAEIRELMMLRLTIAILSGSTLLLMQTCILLHEPLGWSWMWAVHVSGVIGLVSVTWAVSTFRRHLPQPEFGAILVAWPGTFLRICWRAGEILARVLSLSLFASLYTNFIFLVIGLHWLCMFACLHIPPITSIKWPTTNCVKRTLASVLISFAHVFAFINTSSENAVFRYTFYYVIFFLENSILVAIWFIQSSPEQFSRNSLFAYIGASLFVSFPIAMIIYYKFFHVINLKDASSSEACDNSVCTSCNSHEKSQSDLAGQGDTQNWLRKAVTNHFLDSDINSTVTTSSSRDHQQRNHYEVEGEVTQLDRQQKSKVRNFLFSIKSFNKNDHRKKSSAKQNKGCPPEESNSSPETKKQQVTYQGSTNQPVWLPTVDTNFESQLLTFSLENFDTTETADECSVASCCNGDHDRWATSPFSVLPSGGLYKRANEEKLFPTDTREQNLCYDTRNMSQERHILTPTLPFTISRDLEIAYMSSRGITLDVSDTASRVQFQNIGPSPEIVARTALNNVYPSSHQLHPDSHQLHSNRHGNHQQHVNHKTHNLPSPSKQQLSYQHNHTHKDITQTKHAHKGITQSDLESCAPNRKYHCPGDNKTNLDSQTKSGGLEYRIKMTAAPVPQRQITFVNKIAEIPASTEAQGCRNKKQTHIYSLAQNDKLATELLKGSDQMLKHKPNSAVGATLATTDPRFTYRVMTTTGDDTCLFADGDRARTPISGNDVKASKEKDLQLGLLKPESRKKPQIDQGNSSGSSDVSKDQETLMIEPDLDLCTPDVHANIIEQSVVTVTDDIYDKVIIYENLWPGKQRKQATVLASGERYRTAMSRPSERRDVHTNSESEDSAFPQEALSSSAECFSVSESDSYGSLEVVI